MFYVSYHFPLSSAIIPGILGKWTYAQKGGPLVPGTRRDEFVIGGSKNMEHVQGDSSAQIQATPKSAAKLIKSTEQQGWECAGSWEDAATYLLELSANLDGGAAEFELRWVDGTYKPGLSTSSGGSSEMTIGKIAEFVSENEAVKDECETCDPETDRVCHAHAVAGTFDRRFGWGKWGETAIGSGFTLSGTRVTRNYELVDWETGPDFSSIESPGYAERYATGQLSITDVIPLDVRDRSLGVVPTPDMVGDCHVREDAGFNGYCESYGVRLYLVSGRLMCAQHAERATGIPARELETPPFDDEEQIISDDCKADALRHRIFRGAESWAEEQDAAGHHIPARGWESWAEEHHEDGGDYAVTFRRWLIEREWDGADWAAWAFESAPLPMGSVPVSVGRAGLLAVGDQPEPVAQEEQPEPTREKHPVESPAANAERLAKSVAGDPLFATYPPLVGPLPFSREQEITVLEPGYERVVQFGQEWRVRTEGKRVTAVYHVWYGWDHACNITREHALNTVIHIGSFVEVSRSSVLLGLHTESPVRCDQCEPGWAWGRGKKPKGRLMVGGQEAAVCLGGFHSSWVGVIPGEFVDGLDPDQDQEQSAAYAAWVGGTGPKPPTAAERLAAKASKGRRRKVKQDQEQGESTVGRGSMAPKRKAAEVKGKLEPVEWLERDRRAEFRGHEFHVVKETRYTVYDRGVLVCSDLSWPNAKAAVREWDVEAASQQPAVLHDASFHIGARVAYVSGGLGTVKARSIRRDGSVLLSVATDENPHVGYPAQPVNLRIAVEATAERMGPLELEAGPVRLALTAGVDIMDAVVVEEEPDTAADLMAVDGAELIALLDSLTEEQRQALAGEWPVRWLYPEQEGDRPRGLNFCAGCGGGCKGKRLVTDSDMVCVDLAKDAVATSEAAGCTVVRADVKTLTPEHPALRWTSEVTFTMPCLDWTVAGNGAGRDASNLEILVEAIAQVGFAFGNYEKDGTEYCTHEEDGEECSWEEGCFSSYGERTDMTVPEMWALVDGITGKTAGLMLAPVIWCLGLRYIGAPLRNIVIEQAAQLPSEIQDEIWLELSVAGCESAEWDVLDAADFGSPSHRKRSIMAAHWYRMAALPEAPGITTLAYEAIDWDADAEINTRGERKTSGGNVFRMDGVTSRHPEPKPINGITSKIRGWYEATTERRFTIGEVCLLVGLPADYPVTGSRSSQCQQLGDIFSPLVSLAVWGQLLGVPWRELLRRYLAELYPAVHGQDADAAESTLPADTAGIREEESAGVEPEAEEQVSEPADTEENEDPRSDYGLHEGERVRYVGGHESEYAVMLAGDPERYVCGVGHTGERMEGAYTYVSPWSHGGKNYSIRFEGKRFASVEFPCEILPAVRKHVAKQAHSVKAQPTPGLYAPTLHAEERTGDVADECRANGHRYVWLVVEAEGVSRTLRSYMTCACTGEKLGNFGRSGPSMNQGTQSKPLGIRDASIASALGVAKRNSYTTKGPWEVLSETLKRCPVEWDHATPSKVAADPARDGKSLTERLREAIAEKDKNVKPGHMAALLEKHVGADWKPLEATADPEFVEEEEEPQAPVQGLAQITREQRRAAWRLASGETRKPSTRVFESGTLVLVDGQRAARVGSSDFVRVRYVHDDQFTHPVTRERLTRVLSCSAQQPVALTVPRRAVALVESQVPTCEALETYVVPEVPALAICGEPVILVVPKLAVDPRIEWATYERPAPADPRVAWMDYPRPEPGPVDVLAELRAELEELRRDVDTWGGLAAATVVANAETIVRELAAELRMLEVEALRQEARELREELGWGPVRWTAIETPRGRRWALAASVAGTVAGLGAALGQVVPPRG